MILGCHLILTAQMLTLPIVPEMMEVARDSGV